MKNNPKLFALEAIETLIKVSENTNQITENDEFESLRTKIIREYLKSEHNMKRSRGLFSGIKENDMNFFPISYKKILNLFQKPLEEWGLFTKNKLEEQEVNDLILLDEMFGVSDDATELLNEEESSKEFAGSPVLEALTHCRQKQKNGEYYQDIYVNFRKFLIKNPLTTRNGIRKMIKKLGGDDELLSILFACYEDIPTSNTKYVCQNCGWTTYYKSPSRYSCVKSTCQIYYDEATLSGFLLADKDVTMRTLSAIQFSTVIPGQKEFCLKELLEKKGYMVEMYPNIERDGDLKAYKEGQTLYIDVKDYTKPKRLADYLVTNIGKIKNGTIIAIPNENAKKVHGYVSKIKKRLINEEITTIDVKKFNEI